MAFAFSVKRFIVLAVAIALCVIAIINLVHGGTVARIIVNAVVLAISLYGVFGVLHDNPRYLQLFLLLLAVLLIWEIIYIIVSAVSYGYNASNLALDIVIAILLVWVLGFDQDLLIVSKPMRVFDTTVD
jgi:hypothetical protein